MIDAPLWMLQLQPDAFRVAAWMTHQGVARPGHDDGYGWHALLKAAFGEHAPQPFRVMEPAAGASAPAKPLFVLAYSKVAMQSLMQHAQTYADPDVFAALGLDANVSAKRMPSTFTAGQRLGFEVLVRPTVRQHRDGNRNASREKDAFLAAIDKLPSRAERADQDRDAVYRSWLQQRLGPAASLERAVIARRTRAYLLRRGFETGSRSARPLKSIGGAQHGTGQRGGGPMVVFTGMLIVGDPAAFGSLLARGVGRHLAFGLGMMLLKPPQ